MKTAAPQQKSVKTLKGQLFGAVAMMLVASIALGTSTYAWFINNQTVEVQTMNLTVSTATSLLAAVGKPASVAKLNTVYTKDNFTSYKTTILNTDITGTAVDQAGWSNFLTTPLTPASVCDAQLTVGGENFPMFYKSLNTLVDGKLSTFEALTHDTSAATFTGLGQGPVKHIRLAMVGSAGNLNVYLGKAGTSAGTNTLDIADMVSAVASAPTVNGKDAAAQAAAIKHALRIAIVAPGAMTVAPVVLQFDAGEDNNTNVKGNNTYYGTATDAASPGDSTTENETTGMYKAIASINIDGTIKTYNQLTANVPTDNKYVAGVTTDASGVITSIVNASKTPLFTLEANTPSIIDVYIWLEGTDKDCLNELSAYNFGLSLPFVAKEATTP